MSPSARDKDNSLTTYRSQDYLTTISRSSDALAVGLPLQNNLTKVPEAKVPAAMDDMAMHSLLGVFALMLEPSNIASVVHVSLNYEGTCTGLT